MSSDPFITNGLSDAMIVVGVFADSDGRARVNFWSASATTMVVAAWAREIVRVVYFQAVDVVEAKAKFE